MRQLLIISLAVLGFQAWAAVNADKDFDALGGNRVILEKAKALNPEVTTTIVQKRMVNRRQRVEFAPEYGSVFGGNSYNQTQNLGLNIQFHFTPRWSIGAKYNYSFNNLTPDGRAAYDRALKDFEQNPQSPTTPFPLIDYPKSETMGLLNWYPIYGKMNLLDQMVAHFDVYALAGYGQVQLASGSSSTWTAGGGLGIWWSPHLSSRLEARYQTYTTKSLNREQDLDLVVGSVQMGWLL